MEVRRARVSMTQEIKIRLLRALVFPVIGPVVEHFTLNFDGLQIGEPLNVVRTSCLVICTYGRSKKGYVFYVKSAFNGNTAN
jgi:hypothetical protein